MSKILLPPTGIHPHEFNFFNDAELRARDLEVARVVLEAAAKLKPDAMEIFNSNPAMTPQETRDVIEWYDGSIRALEVGHE